MGNRSSKNGAESLENTIRFPVLESKICTGDLAILKRPDGDVKHYAVFIQRDKSDEHFPLLLVKGKTKPMASFDSKAKRYANPVSATARIFYGDYETVAVRHLVPKIEFPCHEALKLVNELQNIPFSEEEVTAVHSAKSDTERSSILSAFMIAHLYKKLGVLKADPLSITPQNLEDNLGLDKPVYIRLPKVKERSGDPPLLFKLVAGIKPPPDVDAVKIDSILPELKTGDIVLMSGVSSGGAIIQLFDDSEFSHVAIVIRLKYSDTVFVWESTQNSSGMVDVESGAVEKGVALVPLKNKILSGWDERVAVRKLTGIDDEKREKMYKELMKFQREVQGKAYEKNFLQMAMAAFDFKEEYLSFLKNSKEDLSSIFCSELVAEAYQRMGLLGSKKNSNEYTPKDFSSQGDEDNPLLLGKLEKEIYIELKLD